MFRGLPLSDEDKGHLCAAFKKASVVHLGVDLQKLYCDPGCRSLGKYTFPPSPHNEKLAINVNRFAKETRGSSLRHAWVVHTPSLVYGALEAALNPGSAPNLLPYMAASAAQRVFTSEKKLVRDELHKITPEDGDLLLRKNHMDAFRFTGLHRELKRQGTDTLLLTGLELDQCVAATAMRAAKLGYKTFVIGDLTAGGLHPYVIEDHLAARGVRITDEATIKSFMPR